MGKKENATKGRMRIRVVMPEDRSKNVDTSAPSTVATPPARSPGKRKNDSRQATESASEPIDPVLAELARQPIYDPRSLRVGERIRNALNLIRAGSSVDSAFASQGIGRKALAKLCAGRTTSAKRLRERIRDASGFVTASAEVEVRQAKPLEWLKAQRERPGTSTVWNEKADASAMMGAGQAGQTVVHQSVKVLNFGALGDVLGQARQLGFSTPESHVKDAWEPGRSPTSEHEKTIGNSTSEEAAARRIEVLGGGSDYEKLNPHTRMTNGNFPADPSTPPALTPSPIDSGSTGPQKFFGTLPDGPVIDAPSYRKTDEPVAQHDCLPGKREEPLATSSPTMPAGSMGRFNAQTGQSEAVGKTDSGAGRDFSYTSKNHSFQEGERSEGKAAQREQSSKAKAVDIAEKKAVLRMGQTVICDECKVGELKVTATGALVCDNCRATGRLAFRIGEHDMVPESVKKRAASQIGARKKFPKLVNRADKKQVEEVKEEEFEDYDS